jgi:hypothetical protein
MPSANKRNHIRKSFNVSTKYRIDAQVAHQRRLRPEKRKDKVLLYFVLYIYNTKYYIFTTERGLSYALVLLRGASQRPGRTRPSPPLPRRCVSRGRGRSLKHDTPAQQSHKARLVHCQGNRINRFDTCPPILTRVRVSRLHRDSCYLNSCCNEIAVTR